MAGIFGIALPNRYDDVVDRIETIRHRGGRGLAIVEHERATLGEVHGPSLGMWLGRTPGCSAVFDGALFNWRELSPEAHDVDQAIQDAFEQFGIGFLRKLDGPFALAVAHDDGVFVARDAVGIAPLYYGYRDGAMCFASEAKALLGWAFDVREFPPGHCCGADGCFIAFSEAAGKAPETIGSPAQTLRSTLSEAVTKRASTTGDLGCWLSGGVDSSAMAALATLCVPKLKTFAVGLEGAPDLAFAQQVATHIDSEHFEMRLEPEALIKALPDVIRALESFDALLVRSSLTNYFVGRLASDNAEAVLSGEGGDELFAGYDYLKHIPESELNSELVDITGRLHNTALQRVDRCSSAHGLKAFVPFLDGEVRRLAFSMGQDLKICRDSGVVDKWVLRQAVAPLLPAEVATRPKAKFWEGAGVTDVIESYADSIISDEVFLRNRVLPDGASLNTKEEYLYFLMFTESFGELDDYSFMGRTKNAPRAA